jgi:hypothetical protein
MYDQKYPRLRAWLAAVISSLLLSPSAMAGSLEQAFMKLAPEERSRQICINRGLETVRRDARLRGADRMKTSIITPSVLEGSTLTAKGGAVRVNHRWFALSFTCQMTKDAMRATSFTFELGREIPKNKWQDYGLWE